MYPIIIIGMSRSGTSLLTRLLEAQGLFVGKRKTATHEAAFFQRLNKWLFLQCGAGLETPAPFERLLDDTRSKSLLVRILRDAIRTPRVASYLGIGGYLKWRGLEKVDRPWGWKDPRNTFTLPIWLEIFPQARVVHALRHGVDVAGSLKKRRNRIASRMEGRLDRLGIAYSIHLTSPRLLGRRKLAEIECATLAGGFSLWECYVQNARAHVAKMGNRAIEVRYEDLLADPGEVLRILSSFCDLDASEEDTARASQMIRKDRAYAYRADQESVAFSESVQARLSRIGY